VFRQNLVLPCAIALSSKFEQNLFSHPLCACLLIQIISSFPLADPSKVCSFDISARLAHLLNLSMHPPPGACPPELILVNFLCAPIDFVVRLFAVHTSLSVRNSVQSIPSVPTEFRYAARSSRRL